MVVLPISILGSANTNYSSEIAASLGFSFLISFGYYIFAIIFMLFAGKLLISDESRRKVFTNLGIFANTSFLGFPVILALLGDEGFIYAVVYNLAFQFFFFSFAIQYISGVKKFDLVSILKEPGTIASILAIGLFLLQIKLPEMVIQTTNIVGSMMTPLSLLIIGAKLSQIDFKEIVKERQVYLVSALRLIIFPLILLPILNFFQLNPVLIAAMVVLTAMPSGAMNVIIAEKYRADVNFATLAVAQSTFLMIVTLPLILFLVSS